MKDVYKLLLNRSNDAVLLPNNRLFFEFNGYEILFDLKGDSEDEVVLHEGTYNLSNSDLQNISERTVNDCFIASSEYLGYREDIITYNVPKSICLKLYHTIKLLEKYKPGSIRYFTLSLNDGYGEDSFGSMMCGLESNYLFEIHPNRESYSNADYFLEVLDILISSQEIPDMPKFYWNYYKAKKSFVDSYEVSILGTNTKSRRLGYLKILSELFKSYKKIPSARINRRFQDAAIRFENDLAEYDNSKGKIIATKTGSSASPYLALANNLNWITSVNIVQVPGKMLRVYQILNKELEADRETNIFELSKFERFFFLEIFLAKDYQYISIILELLYVQGARTYKELNQQFQFALLSRFDEFMRNTRESNPKEYKSIKTIHDRIKKWEEPETYLEHVLMPRLNWLHDLKLISLSEEKLDIDLKLEGKRLFEHFCFWNDINAARVINPKEFLDRFSIHIFHETYEGTEPTNYEKIDQIRRRIDFHLENCFSYFKTLAPNRITSSQGIMYVKYKLYFEENIKVSYRFIENHLRKEVKDKFIYKFQKQYRDGYIQKK